MFHFIQITLTQRQENLIRAGTNKPRFHHQSIKIEKDICTPKYLEEIGTISITSDVGDGCDIRDVGDKMC